MHVYIRFPVISTDPCLANPCQFGSCNNTNSTEFTCLCNTGYTGSLCDTCKYESNTGIVYCLVYKSRCILSYMYVII